MVYLNSLNCLPVPVVGADQDAVGISAGAIKIVATGTLTIGGDIWAVGGQGGKVTTTTNPPSVGGSGSAVRFT